MSIINNREENELMEMVLIASSDEFGIWIYTEPLGQPSFHLIFNDKQEIVLSMIDLRVLEVKRKGKYLKSIKKGAKLPEWFSKELLLFLNEPNEIGYRIDKKESPNKIFIPFMWNCVNYKYQLTIKEVEQFEIMR